jgi:tRNA modification GTPase
MTLFGDDTIAALATPPGTGGIGVVRVSGPLAFAIVDSITGRPRGRSVASYHGHTLHRANVITAAGESIDDVLLAVFHAPRSYTGEDVVEISGHGGPIPMRRILTRLLEQGARLAQPGEFTQRAFLNGKIDLAQAEAVGDIIAAQTEEAHRLAQRQGEGRLSREVTRVRDIVLGVLARIEASIDFPEDVGDLDTSLCGSELERAAASVRELLATADRGILMRQGLKLVLAGRPNVGKSSLLNALLRTARAIVTPIPGTTRDVIEESLNLRGMPIRAIDTAGLRETDDPVERIGVERSRQSLAEADLVLFVQEASAGETPEDVRLRAGLGAQPYLLVWNKWDLVTAQPPEAENAISVSAETGWNIDVLEDEIAKVVLHGQAAPGDEAAAVVTHARHRAALQAAQAAIENALGTLRAGLPADFVSVDVRSALTALGEITGETASEDVISEIFDRFCIGK